jgi:hypothetical protein
MHNCASMLHDKASTVAVKKDAQRVSLDASHLVRTPSRFLHSTEEGHNGRELLPGASQSIAGWAFHAWRAATIWW